jgi:hypothetical protein
MNGMSLLNPLLSLVLLLLPAPGAARSDLEKARAGIHGGDLFGLRLPGPLTRRELSLGASLQLLSLTGSGEGGIFLFDGKGRLLGKAKTGGIESIQILDLDGDGVSEILTEEETGHGTGIVGTEFRLYKVRDGSLVKLWGALAYEHLYAESSRPQERRIGFVRPIRREGSFALLYGLYDAVKKSWSLREIVLSPSGVREEKADLLEKP